MKKLIKVILAVLFFACLFKLPYSYYQLVRFLALIGFAFLAFESFKDENQLGMIVYIGLAILFQPLIKIALGRELWNIVDVVVGIGLLISIFMEKDKKQKE